MRKVATLVVVLAGYLGLGVTAQASTYHLSGPLVDRHGPSGNDTGYRGPRFEVTPWGSSSDTYVCPTGTDVSNWVAVPALPGSVGRSFAPFSYGDRGTEPTNEITIHVTNWSLAATVDLSAVISCTTAPSEFPYPPPPIPGCHRRPGRNCIPRSRLASTRHIGTASSKDTPPAQRSTPSWSAPRSAGARHIQGVRQTVRRRTLSSSRCATAWT